MTIMEQQPSTVNLDEARSLSPIELASFDGRVARLAERFSHCDFTFDPAEVGKIALDYGISAYEVTEGACVQNRMIIADQEPDDEA